MHMTSAPGHRPRPGALVGLLAGLVLVLAPIGVWAATPAPVVAAASPVAPALPAAPPVVAVLPEVGSTGPTAPEPPVRIRLPALGVDAPVAPVGIDDQGQMAVPLDVATVGWYRF